MTLAATHHRCTFGDGVCQMRLHFCEALFVNKRTDIHADIGTTPHFQRCHFHLHFFSESVIDRSLYIYPVG